MRIVQRGERRSVDGSGAGGVGDAWHSIEYAAVYMACMIDE